MVQTGTKTSESELTTVSPQTARRKHKQNLTHEKYIRLKYRTDFSKKIPRLEVKLIHEIIQKQAIRVDPLLKPLLVGSYRRGMRLCDDITIVVTHPHNTRGSYWSDAMFKNFTKVLEESGLIIDSISFQPTKFKGVCRLEPKKPARVIDMVMVSANHYICSVLHYTGSAAFVDYLRSMALKAGYKLDEYNLRQIMENGDLGDPIELNDEEDVFHCINYTYKKPKERNWRK